MGKDSNNQSTTQGGNQGKGTPMTSGDASRIQSSQARGGFDTGKGSFAARAQSAGATNANQGIGGDRK